MTFAKIKEEAKEPVDPNNGYNIDEEYDELVAEQAEKDAKYQDVIDYINNSELMSIKKVITNVIKKNSCKKEKN